MPMKSLDITNEERNKILQKMTAAAKSENAEEFSNAFLELATHIENNILSDAREIVGQQDVNILASRGVRQLTAGEKTYYESIIEAMRAPAPKQALTNISVTMPETIIESVFDDLQTNFPVLETVNIINTTFLTKWIINNQTAQTATWGAVGTAITKELSGAFLEIDVTMCKLTAFFPVSKDMIALGANWLDRYIRTILAEANGFALEQAIIDGTGNNQPIGMTRSVADDVTVVGGVYPRKTKIAVTSFAPLPYGELLSQLAKSKTGRDRAITEVTLYVNPTDYLKKVMPATTILKPDGTFASSVFPFPTKVVQTAALASGDAVLGLPKRYFAGMGTKKEGVIEYSDEYQFIEDNRVYTTRLYGNGRPMDDNAFLYLDISNLKPLVRSVKVVNGDDEAIPVFPANDARLASLAIGSRTLTPVFNKSTHSYTLATDSVSEVVNAIAMDGEATITVKLNGAAITNGSAATWTAGANTLEITVAIGDATETYNVTVTQVDTTLSAISIGSLTLTPTFDGDTTTYTTTTGNATNTITATATDTTGATVAIKNGDTTVESGSAATWATGENTVTVTVTNAGVEKVYTVVVTKS